jgi:hypothetical protein
MESYEAKTGTLVDVKDSVEDLGDIGGDNMAWDAVDLFLVVWLMGSASDDMSFSSTTSSIDGVDVDDTDAEASLSLTTTTSNSCSCSEGSAGSVSVSTGV